VLNAQSLQWLTHNTDTLFTCKNQTEPPVTQETRETLACHVQDNVYISCKGCSSRSTCLDNLNETFIYHQLIWKRAHKRNTIATQIKRLIKSSIIQIQSWYHYIFSSYLDITRGCSIVAFTPIVIFYHSQAICTLCTVALLLNAMKVNESNPIMSKSVQCFKYVFMKLCIITVLSLFIMCHIFTTPLPLRPSGNYMNHLLWQSVILYFVFIGFAWFSL
jgi:hypothetical protein